MKSTTLILNLMLLSLGVFTGQALAQNEGGTPVKEAISIEGRLLMLDDATSHVAVPVQAIRVGEWARERVDEGAREQGSRKVSSFTFHVSRKKLLPQP